ncbi:MAG: pyrroline-5-carboxylate reductase [Tannerella sp.]|jgi:pyrroline-5-carboxylate reductase|nr:pyrroline-5-carboxylate reductase [Tannerella sp.]
MKLTIIGAGNMGSAIVRGLVKGTLIKPFDITCSDTSTEALAGVRNIHAAIRTVTDNRAAADSADIVLLAVKPWLLEKVIYEIKLSLDYERQIIISIAGGVTFAQLDKYLDSHKGVEPALFRLIPNTAVAVQNSMTFIASQNATPAQTDTVTGIFDELGATMAVDERLMAAGTSLASCGIAYAFRYIRAAMEGGVELGFYPSQARDVVLQTLKGAVALMEANGNHPEEEIDRVTTPGGLTIKGLNEMENAGFTSAVIRGLKASRDV